MRRRKNQTGGESGIDRRTFLRRAGGSLVASLGVGGFTIATAAPAHAICSGTGWQSVTNGSKVVCSATACHLHCSYYGSCPNCQPIESAERWKKYKNVTGSTQYVWGIPNGPSCNPVIKQKCSGPPDSSWPGGGAEFWPFVGNTGTCQCCNC